MINIITKTNNMEIIAVIIIVLWIWIVYEIINAPNENEINN